MLSKRYTQNRNLRKNMLDDTPGRYSRPNLLLYMSEFARAMFELGTVSLAKPWLEKSNDDGGHAVLVIPGFMTSGRSTKSLRKTLTSLGYDTHTWNQGVSLGVRQELFDGVITELDRLFDEYDEKISVIGQSLGGIYARELAKIRADKIRQVITLGSPINDPTGSGSHVAGIYKFLNPGHLGDNGTSSPIPEWDIGVAPPVPTTVIYSKFDGICHWQTCVQHGQHSHVENLPIASSHIGMAVNAQVVYAIAARLAKPR